MPQNYNRRRTFRVDKFEVVRKPGNLTEDFNLLFRILLFAGLVFPSLNRRKQKPKRCEKFFEAFIHFFAVLIIVVNIFFWQKRYSSVTLHFSTTLTIFLAISVRFVLTYCRKKIPDMVKNLISLHDDITWRKPESSIKRPIVLACIMPFLLTTIAAGIDVYNLLADRAKEQHSVQFVVRLNGVSHETWMYYMFLVLVPIKMYFAYGVSVVILIFICVVYTVVKRTVFALDEQVSDHDRSGAVVNDSAVGLYLNFYNRLGKTIAEIDEVLSPCVLLLYGLMVSGQLYTLTVLISKDANSGKLTKGVQNAIVFLLTTIAFLVVTLTAAKMTEYSENVKRSVHKLADRVARSRETVLEERSVTNAYMILITILNGSHLSFTGWGMFNINRSFILTTMGVMISYGFIIVQIGHKNNIEP